MIQRVLRVKRDAQQSLLATEPDSRRNVEKWRRLEDAVPNDPNPSSLFDDENAPVVEGLRHKHGRREAGRYEIIELEADAWRQRRAAIARARGIVTPGDGDHGKDPAKSTNHG
jgi:hypothetical protein